MFRRELLILVAAATAVFALVALATYWVGHIIRTEATYIAGDTLPGLVDAGSALAVMQENWLRVNLLQHTQSPRERAELIHQIQTNRTDDFWTDYGKGIYAEEDRKNFAELQRVRADFLSRRDQYFELVKNDPAAAEPFFRTQLEPLYGSYRELSTRLFQYNARIGQGRAAKVIRFAKLAPLVLGGGGVFVFGLGVILGLRGAFTGLHLASRAGRVRS